MIVPVLFHNGNRLIKFVKIPRKMNAVNCKLPIIFVLNITYNLDPLESFKELTFDQ